MKKADASPTKDFFVRMITKDISLEDCLLDLIDNCLDGARRALSKRPDSGQAEDRYDGFHTSLTITSEEFKIEDNCGGISIDNAIDYAFHFGRRPDAPTEGDFSIGLYGIGMKRAILKMGREIRIHSSTEEEAFLCTIPVDEWLKNNDWEFDMDDAERLGRPGTAILIKNLYGGVAEEFEDATFVNGLARIVGRDYARFIEKGFKIYINDTEIKNRQYAVKSDEHFHPYRHTYDDHGVEVDILAGMAASPPDSNDPSEDKETEYYGWFVFCNDRVVLAADKTDRTVWGDEGFPRWHPQYNGFMGMVLFRGSDPNLLPWTTTKREVDESSPLYRRAVKKMKDATQPWTVYTNQRKFDLDEAKKKESAAQSVPVFSIRRDSAFKVPRASSKPQVRMANISYQKPLSQVEQAARTLGNRDMSYKSVGERTFDYFIEHEAGGED